MRTQGGVLPDRLADAKEENGTSRARRVVRVVRLPSSRVASPRERRVPAASSPERREFSRPNPASASASASSRRSFRAFLRLRRVFSQAHAPGDDDVDALRVPPPRGSRARDVRLVRVRARSREPVRAGRVSHRRRGEALPRLQLRPLRPAPVPRARDQGAAEPTREARRHPRVHARVGAGQASHRAVRKRRDDRARGTRAENRRRALARQEQVRAHSGSGTRDERRLRERTARLRLSIAIAIPPAQGPSLAIAIGPSLFADAARISAVVVAEIPAVPGRPTGTPLASGTPPTPRALAALPRAPARRRAPGDTRSRAVVRGVRRVPVPLEAPALDDERGGGGGPEPDRLPRRELHRLHLHGRAAAPRAVRDARRDAPGSRRVEAIVPAAADGGRRAHRARAAAGGAALVVAPPTCAGGFVEGVVPAAGGGALGPRARRVPATLEKRVERGDVHGRRRLRAQKVRQRRRRERAPAVQAPAVQAPAVQAPAVQAPAVQAPAVGAERGIPPRRRILLAGGVVGAEIIIPGSVSRDAAAAAAAGGNRTLPARSRSPPRRRRRLGTLEDPELLELRVRAQVVAERVEPPREAHGGPLRPELKPRRAVEVPQVDHDQHAPALAAATPEPRDPAGTAAELRRRARVVADAAEGVRVEAAHGLLVLPRALRRGGVTVRGRARARSRGVGAARLGRGPRAAGAAAAIHAHARERRRRRHRRSVRVPLGRGGIERPLALSLARALAPARALASARALAPARARRPRGASPPPRARSRAARSRPRTPRTSAPSGRRRRPRRAEVPPSRASPPSRSPPSRSSCARSCAPCDPSRTSRRELSAAPGREMIVGSLPKFPKRSSSSSSACASSPTATDPEATTQSSSARTRRVRNTSSPAANGTSRANRSSSASCAGSRPRHRSHSSRARRTVEVVVVVDFCFPARFRPPGTEPRAEGSGSGAADGSAFSGGLIRRAGSEASDPGSFCRAVSSVARSWRSLSPSPRTIWSPENASRFSRQRRTAWRSLRGWCGRSKIWSAFRWKRFILWSSRSLMSLTRARVRLSQRHEARAEARRACAEA